MTTKFMTDPVRILVKRDELTLEGLKQYFIAVEKEDWKFDTLCDLIAHAAECHGDIVICGGKAARFRRTDGAGP